MLQVTHKHGSCFCCYTNKILTLFHFLSSQSRVRLSFTRRPPTRQHRKSAGEEGAQDTPEENRSPCDLHSPDNTPEKNGNTKDSLNVPQEETHESQEHSTPLITVEDTELHEEHDDVTKDNEDPEGENKEEVIAEKSSGSPEAAEAVDNQEEEKVLEEHSTGEMEGSRKEEETSGDFPEENMDAEVTLDADVFYTNGICACIMREHTTTQS